MLVNVGDSEVSKVSRLQRILNDILRWFDIDETNDHRLWVYAMRVEEDTATAMSAKTSYLGMQSESRSR